MDPEILKAIEKWTESQPEQNKTVFFLGGVAYTPRRILEVVKQDTAEGRRLVEMIHAVSLDLIVRGVKKPE